MTDFECLADDPRGIILRLRASPNARRTAAEGLREGRLRVRVQAPPVDDKANREVERWAAEAFGLRASAVAIVRGQRGREKDVLLSGIHRSEANQALARMLQDEGTGEHV